MKKLEWDFIGCAVNVKAKLPEMFVSHLVEFIFTGKEILTLVHTGSTNVSKPGC